MAALEDKPDEKSQPAITLIVKGPAFTKNRVLGILPNLAANSPTDRRENLDASSEKVGIILVCTRLHNNFVASF